MANLLRRIRVDQFHTHCGVVKEIFDLDDGCSRTDFSESMSKEPENGKVHRIRNADTTLVR